MSENQKLAINGGLPVRTEPFPQWPVIDNDEMDLITEVTKSGKWWRGAYNKDELGSTKVQGYSKVEKFEEEFAKLHKAKYAVATSTGSGALDIAIKAAGVGPGDEVIVPAFTFVATATCVLHNNAVPIFVDIDPATYNIDPAEIEKAITGRTKAIIPVHFSGNIADMDSILEIARKHNLVVIEDAAHAHGVRLKDGRAAGSIGDLSMFSFQQSKNLTAGEGGIVLTNDERLYDLSFSLHHYGREKGRPWYEIHRLGWNFRMSEFQGAILLAQLNKLNDLNQKRQENGRYLSKCLESIEGISDVAIDPKLEVCSYHLFIIKYDKRCFNNVEKNRFVEMLNAEGIPASAGYDAPVYQNPLFLKKTLYNYNCPVDCPHYETEINFKDFEKKCPVAEKACKDEAVLLTQNMLLGDHKDMDSIVEAINKIKLNVD